MLTEARCSNGEIADEVPKGESFKTGLGECPAIMSAAAPLDSSKPSCARRVSRAHGDLGSASEDRRGPKHQAPLHQAPHSGTSGAAEAFKNICPRNLEAIFEGWSRSTFEFGWCPKPLRGGRRFGGTRVSRDGSVIMC